MRTVILVSKEGHCLNDLLFRWKSGLLRLEIAAIISNHRDFYQLAASYNVPFHHMPVTAATKAQAEARQFEIIESEGAELVVLARYMQILSDDLCRKLAGRAINIHHSFLPSFKGAKPYYQAHDRGVKLIGATAHYVTADLDEGPDHRAGRGAGGPQRHGGRPHGPGPRHRKPGAGARREVAQRTPRAAQRPQDRDLQVTATTPAAQCKRRLRGGVFACGVPRRHCELLVLGRGDDLEVAEEEGRALHRPAAHLLEQPAGRGCPTAPGRAARTP